MLCLANWPLKIGAGRISINLAGAKLKPDAILLHHPQNIPTQHLKTSELKDTAIEDSELHKIRRSTELVILKL